MVDEESALNFLAIKQYFLSNLFSEEEAQWAAENNLQPSDPRVQKVVRNRASRIKVLMQYMNESLAEAIEDAANSVRVTNQAKAEYEDIIVDDYNIFMGET